MTTKEKLEVAIRKMEAARKSANETKSDADYIALNQCKKEVEAFRAQVDADGNSGSGDTPAESEGSVGGDNTPTPTPTDEDNTPAEPENKPAESLKEEKPTTTPKPKKEGGKKAKN